MTSITAIANNFFAACETGKGWEACKAYCAPNATFAAQAEPLEGIKTLAEYTDWMKGLMTIMPDGSYEVKSFATDTERNNVTAYAVFSGTHTGPGGPCEPTGKQTTSDYELWSKVGDGGNRKGGISWGCLTPPLLHRRSDMPCPKITSSS